MMLAGARHGRGWMEPDPDIRIGWEDAMRAVTFVLAILLVAFLFSWHYSD